MDIVAENITVSKQFNQNVTGNTDTPPAYVISGWRRVINDGTGTREGGNGGYREDYTTFATHTSFDVGHCYLHMVDSESARGHYEGEWHMMVGPRDTQGGWTATLMEYNIGNRASDMGYRDNIGGQRCTGGIVMVNTSAGFGANNNVDFAYAVAGGKNNTQAQFYNGLLINPDAIAKGGRGIQINGDTGTATDATPYCPIAVSKTFQSGIHLEGATFRDRVAITIASTHKITKPNGTEAVFLTPKQITRLKKMLRQ